MILYCNCQTCDYNDNGGCVRQAVTISPAGTCRDFEKENEDEREYERDETQNLRED